MRRNYSVYDRYPARMIVDDALLVEQARAGDRLASQFMSNLAEELRGGGVAALTGEPDDGSSVAVGKRPGDPFGDGADGDDGPDGAHPDLE